MAIFDEPRFNEPAEFLTKEEENEMTRIGEWGVDHCQFCHKLLKGKLGEPFGMYCDVECLKRDRERCKKGYKHPAIKFMEKRVKRKQGC